MRISIVTPSYNQAAYLEETLRSVASQREYVHEHFVFDGGSDDGSVDIIKRYSNWIDHWVSEKDDGQGDAIRRGFEKATGDIFYWLNSDDVLMPGVLKRVHEYFNRRPDIDVLTGYAALIDERSRIIKMHRGPHDSPTWLRFGYMRPHQATCFFRRSAYEAAGGIDPGLHCVLDTELWYRLMDTTDRWGHTDSFIAAFRLHSDMKGQRLTEQYRRERSEMKRRYRSAKADIVSHTIGRIAYYFSQAASGRALRNIQDRKNYSGKPLTDVFGDWDLRV